MEVYLKYGIIFAVFALAAIVIAAKPEFIEAKNPAGKTVSIPDYAIEVAPGLYSLGTAVHDGKLVEGYAIIDYREGHGKPSGCNYDGKCVGWEDPSCEDCLGGAEPASTCYGFLSKGARWRTVEPYLFNPSNAQGLDEGFLFNNFELDVAKWEVAAEANIVGTGTTTSQQLAVDLVQPDDKNEIYFGEINEPGAIAITVVWGIFRGPPSSRQLVEWDQIYDQADYGWSTSGEPGKMDFENIATHELGHTMGLDDLYTTNCMEETMYGYADYGETKKRTLEAGDRAGVKELYSN